MLISDLYAISLIYAAYITSSDFLRPLSKIEGADNIIHHKSGFRKVENMIYSCSLKNRTIPLIDRRKPDNSLMRSGSPENNAVGYPDNHYPPGS